MRNAMSFVRDPAAFTAGDGSALGDVYSLRDQALHAVGLDVAYERASGSCMFTHGDARPIWDFLGGYGSTLFGHNHPDLKQVIADFLRDDGVVHAQASQRSAANALRLRLSRELLSSLGRSYQIVFASTGAEAVEIAIKHAEFVAAARGYGTPQFIALKRGFHGMTARARALTHDPHGRFGARSDKGQVAFIDATTSEEVVAAYAQRPRCAGFIFEPIQGEGGIHPIARAVAAKWAAICGAAGIPLIADEIQSGLGRSGTFLYCEQLGIAPDYVLIGKSLGGGLVKIAAVAIAADVFLPSFSLQHASTFAEDDLSARVALRALDLLAEERALERVRERGETIRRALLQVGARYPHIIASVRGEGLMIGLELRELDFERSLALTFMQEYGWLGYALSGYLLHAHHVRVAPALSNGRTLRLEPAYAIPDEAVRALTDGIADLCARIDRHDAAGILAPCLGLEPLPPLHESPPAAHVRTPRTTSHVGFIGHFVDAEGVTLWDPTFARGDAQLAQTFVERVRPFAEPLLCHREIVQGVHGHATTFSFIGVPVTSQQCFDALRRREVDELRQLVQRALDLAAGHGCSAVGLGGYCSIVTRNGRDLEPRGMALTTGNALTAGAAWKTLLAAARKARMNLRSARAAVVGATGNIGSVLAALIAKQVGHLTLIGRPERQRVLQKLASRISADPECSDCQIDISSDLSMCAAADLILCASNSPEAIVTARHLGAQRTIIIDVAVPGDVDAGILRDRSDVMILRGGVIRLPRNPAFRVPGVPLQAGELFACMAETILMGLEPATVTGSRGAIDEKSVLRTLAAAERHGLADFRARHPGDDVQATRLFA